MRGKKHSVGWLIKLQNTYRKEKIEKKKKSEKMLCLDGIDKKDKYLHFGF